MGTTSSTVRDLTARLSSLREGFKEGSERQRSDPEFIRYYLNKVQELGEDLARAIERGDVKPREHSLDELKEAMGNLTRELSFLLSKANGKRDSEDNENTTAEIAVVFFPKVLKGIEDYKKIAKAAGRDVTIDLQVVVGYMTGKPNATDRWKAFAAQELSEVMAIKPKGEKRDAAIVEWNQLLAVIDGESKVIQESRRQEKEERKQAFQGYLDKGEKELPEDWGAESNGPSRLRAAVTAFRNDVANAGWNITEHTAQGFYIDAGAFRPDEILLAETDRDEEAESYYDVEELQKIGHGTSHAERIKGYIKGKVAPKAHRAGLNANNRAVTAFIRAVATEWCSAAESSNTGGNASMVANFSRGDMISTVKDLPDESRTAGLSLDTKIANIRVQLSRETSPDKIVLLKKTLSNLLQQKENS